jgi:AcrR family transcriptional regulator
MAVRTLSTAEARRADVLSAAMRTFARGGYWGANTTEIAHAAGISQAYLYRLFANKEELFVAVIGQVRASLQHEIGRALVGAPKGEKLQALLSSPSGPGASQENDAGMVLLHAAAASSIEPIGAAVRQCYRDQADYLSEQGLSISDIRAYFAWSQYANTLSAAGISSKTPQGDLERLLPQ